MQNTSTTRIQQSLAWLSRGPAFYLRIVDGLDIALLASDQNLLSTFLNRQNLRPVEHIPK